MGEQLSSEGKPQPPTDPKAKLCASFEAIVDQSKVGDPTYDLTMNLHRITLGLVTVEEVGEPFSRADDGTLAINVSGTGLETLHRLISD